MKLVLERLPELFSQSGGFRCKIVEFIFLFQDFVVSLVLCCDEFVSVFELLTQPLEHLKVVRVCDLALKLRLLGQRAAPLDLVEVA